MFRRRSGSGWPWRVRPAARPVASKVAPLAIVIEGELASVAEAVRSNEPTLTAVGPVYVLAPARVKLPDPVLISPPLPEITPENDVLVLSKPVSSVLPPISTLWPESDPEASANEPSATTFPITLVPLRSSVVLLDITTEVLGGAREIRRVEGRVGIAGTHLVPRAGSRDGVANRVVGNTKLVEITTRGPDPAAALAKPQIHTVQPRTQGHTVRLHSWVVNVIDDDVAIDGQVSAVIKILAERVSNRGIARVIDETAVTDGGVISPNQGVVAARIHVGGAGSVAAMIRRCPPPRHFLKRS